MKSLLTLMLMSLTFGGTALAQDHHHHDSKAATSQVKPGERFKADTDLKPRMETILNTMKSLPAKATDAQVKEAGAKVEETVKDIFKNCKLEPKADAAIHPILASILDGAGALKSGNAKKGHEKIHQALLKYEQTFIHEGWNH